MKIAIIENDEIFVKLLKEQLENEGWEVEYFFNSIQFGNAKLNKFDVIIADYSLDSISGKDLIKAIASKTTAQLFLLGDQFDEEDILNVHISGLIHKSNVQDIIEHLKYVEAKLRINKTLEVTNHVYQDFLFKQ